jgi:hypothetical protein
MSTISAGQITTYGEQMALNAIFLKTQSPAVGSVYLHLLTNATSGSVDNTWTTVSQGTVYGATGYTPQTMAVGTASVASPSVISNSGTITFGPFSAGTGATVNWGVQANATATTGNIAVAYLLTASRTPANGDSLQAAAAAFTAQV